MSESYERRSANTVRQRVREWYDEASAKRGNKRREIVVEEHVADLLTWVLEEWEGEKRLALVLDATSLSDCLTSLSVGVVLQGCLIPVAWYLLPAQVPACQRSCGQNNQIARLKTPLTPGEMFLEFRRETEIDDEDMTRESRQGKIIERMDDLCNIETIPALSAARLKNVFRRNIENIVRPVAF